MKLQFAAVALFLVACASSTDNLARETARSIGGITSEQVTNITNVKRGATAASWEADAPTGHYKCEADDMLRRVNCVKQ